MTCLTCRTCQTGETGETGQGYAQALTPEQMQIQQREQAKCIADSDIVITTAQLFGRKPPVLIKQASKTQAYRREPLHRKCHIRSQLSFIGAPQQIGSTFARHADLDQIHGTLNTRVRSQFSINFDNFVDSKWLNELNSPAAKFSYHLGRFSLWRWFNLKFRPYSAPDSKSNDPRITWVRQPNETGQRRVPLGVGKLSGKTKQ